MVLPPDVVRAVVENDAAYYRVARPEQLMRMSFEPSVRAHDRITDLRLPGSPKTGKDVGAKSTLLAAQRRKLGEGKEPTLDKEDLRAKVLDPAYIETVRGESEKKVKKAKEAEAHRAWIAKLKKKDYSGPELDRTRYLACLLYTSPSPRDVEESRMPSSA